MQQKIFIIPGLFNSGPGHWQTKWESSYGFTRIHQKDWQTPVCEDWLVTIEKEIRGSPGSVLVAHSLGCCTVAHLAKRTGIEIGAAMLVAPSDVEAASYPSGTTGFAPMPLNKLSFPSVVVASTDDEYVSIERAKYFARAWGSHFVEAGAYGHINGSSGLGDWPQGFAILQQLLKNTNADTT